MILKKVTGRPRKDDIDKMIEWLLNREIGDCIKLIHEMMVKNGIALNDIITDIHEEVAKIDFPNKIKVSILMVRKFIFEYFFFEIAMFSPNFSIFDRNLDFFDQIFNF